jgi:hypothetical protein
VDRVGGGRRLPGVGPPSNSSMLKISESIDGESSTTSITSVWGLK